MQPKLLGQQYVEHFRTLTHDALTLRTPIEFHAFPV